MKKKCLFLISLIFAFISSGYSQNEDILTPRLNPLRLSLKKEQKFVEHCAKCQTIIDKYLIDEDYQPTKKEERFFRNCGDEANSYWKVGISKGCSWYCAGGPKELEITGSPDSTTSSKASDLNYSTVWKKESKDSTEITFTFNFYTPRITYIVIANGNFLSKKHWRKSGKAKLIQLMINDEPHVFLRLKKTRKEQLFSLEPMGNDPTSYREDGQYDPWELKLKILSTYKNRRNNPLEISDIYFDGIDIH